MSSLEDIVPVIGDPLAIKIISLWRKTQDANEIVETLSANENQVLAKLRLLLRMELISPGGIISEEAKALILSAASDALRKNK